MFILAIPFTHKGAPSDLLFLDHWRHICCLGGGRLFEGRVTLDRENLQVSSENNLGANSGFNILEKSKSCFWQRKKAKVEVLF